MNGGNWVNDRANRIHNKRATLHEHTTEELNAIWKETVHDRETAYLYFQKYHPERGDILNRALAHYLERAMNGEVELPERMLRKCATSGMWDWEKELDEARLEGKMKLAEKRMEELLKEEDGDGDKEKKTK